MASGLIMSSYAAHGCVPSVYNDMKEKREFNSMLNISYWLICFVYFCVAFCGYLMFGCDLVSEITINMSQIAQYSKFANNFLVFLMILGPLSKFPLVVRPISITLESCVQEYFNNSTNLWRYFCSTTASLIILVISLAFPSFDKVMSIVGSLFSFAVSIILPCIFYLRLCDCNMCEKYLIYTIISLSIPASILGTISSFVL
eukprot:NODE_107_length_18988_cov_0.534491.p11 type:complete len:201 gc:universal NODE_107_length_18988_cov_0.534491:3560-2958(-)